MKKYLSIIAFLAICFQLEMCKPKEVVTPFNEPPEWSKNQIWYQIFVERFNNGDKNNDPKPPYMKRSNEEIVPSDWALTPWNSDWYALEPWRKSVKHFYEALGARRYGGDLQGVIDKLDYLQDLGITAIYFNPINDAPSLHKYDARNYHHIDITFGPDPEGDLKLIAQENPADPSTWKWTSADKLFLKLIDELHKRKMKIMLDYSWNHTGTEFWAFKDVVKNQEKSVYKDWYAIKKFDDASTPENEFEYIGWANIKSLPEIKKVNIVGERISGYPYEGNINDGAKQHIFDVSKRWLAPDGDVSKGIDGYRMDVADQIPMGFWRDYRKFVRGVKSDTYLIGEIWWAAWPDVLMNPVPYTSGDIFDAVMFYQVYRPARYFFANTKYPIDGNQLADSLKFQYDRLRESVKYAMMNVNATHDAPRLLTDFFNNNKYKSGAKPSDDSTYKTSKPDTETYLRVKLYLMQQFTAIGSPSIWNGDEMGMWGADDPDCRKPLMWKEFKFDNETANNFQKGEKKYDEVAFNQELFDFYKQIIRIRKENSVLTYGAMDFFKTEGKTLLYKRYDKDNQIFVVFNLGNDKRTIELPEDGTYVNLLDNATITGKKVELNVLSGMILKKK